MAGRYQFDRLVSILSPMWMPDGSSIVFSGLSESGVSDLYRVRLPSGRLEPLTRDRYQDLDPSPTPDGRRLVFASDRTAGGQDGAVNLFMLDLSTGASPSSPWATWVDEAPTWGPGWTDLFHLGPGRGVERVLHRHLRVLGGGRPLPGVVPSIPCPCPTAADCWLAGFTI